MCVRVSDTSARSGPGEDPQQKSAPQINKYSSRIGCSFPERSSLRPPPPARLAAPSPPPRPRPPPSGAYNLCFMELI